MTSENKPGRPSYHHGDLRDALIRATDEILAEAGLEGFSLRKAARRAGVTPAAPAHHFGSAAGLLTEVAILGYEELERKMTVDRERGEPIDWLKAQAAGYVRFALAFPGRFQLMFRRDLLLPDDPRLEAAATATYNSFAQTMRALRHVPEDAPLDEATHAMLLAGWSTVHGFAHLALTGKLLRKWPDATPDQIITRLLPMVLDALWPRKGD